MPQGFTFLQNLIAVLISFFLFLLAFVGFNFSCKPQLPVSWACEMKFQPANRAVLQTLLFGYNAEGIVNRGEVFWQAPEVISVYGISNLSIISLKKSYCIYFDICWILAHIIIEVSKFGYFIFSSFIYWHGLIQTQIDYLNLWMQVDLNVKTVLAYCYFLFTGIKYCVAVKEMYNSNPVWTSLLLSAKIVQGLNNQCERIEETHRNV